MTIMTSDSTVKRHSKSISAKLARCGHRRHLSSSMLEKISRSGGYRFMASDSGNEAEVLETLIA